MELGLFYFSSTQCNNFINQLIDQAKQAENSGFNFVMYPERHFDPFGGPFNNPLVIGSIIGTHTSQIKIRTGSLIPVLHHPVRLLEQLRLMDHCCQGRMELSLGSGWHPNDFVFSPDLFIERKEFLSSFIQDLDEWYTQGDFKLKNGVGKTVDLKVYPPAQSTHIPVWLTISSRPEAWEYAGQQGLHIFTHMENVDHETLAERIDVYRSAFQKAGRSRSKGKVTVMQHTLLSENFEGQGRELLKEYLSEGVQLEKKSVIHSGSMSGNKTVDINMLNDETTDDLLERAVDKYLSRTSLVCTPMEAALRIKQLEGIGVDEIACLVDFHTDLKLQEITINELAEVIKMTKKQDEIRKELLNDFCS